jgi:hypothetical protein
MNPGLIGAQQQAERQAGDERGTKVERNLCEPGGRHLSNQAGRNGACAGRRVRAEIDC